VRHSAGRGSGPKSVGGKEATVKLTRKYSQRLLGPLPLPAPLLLVPSKMETLEEALEPPKARVNFILSLEQEFKLVSILEVFALGRRHMGPLIHL
jgi:hypothetical protein